MATGGELPPWDKTNPEQQEILGLSLKEPTESINKLLTKKRPDLAELIDPSVLWPHLRSLDVVSSRELEEIKFNAIRHVQVERLLDHLERGPAWRFHALLRACALTNQECVLFALEFDPQTYKTKGEPQTSSTQSMNDETPKIRLSGTLLRGIRDHCRACRQKLMRTKLFDFDSDPKAEVLNIAEYFVQVDLKNNQTARENKGKLSTIPEDLILRRFNNEDPPQLTRLDGAPGAGKTTFLKHLVHKWSDEFLQLSCDPVLIEKGQFSLMVYLHVRTIKGSVREAIRNALWCRKKDKDVLMNHVEMSNGVAVLIDATDELRNEAIINELREYVDEQMMGSQRILISSRTDLCRIDPEKFDRLLVLQGFSLPQAMDYVKSYFPSRPPASQAHPILTYIQDHQQELEPILTNPLQLHILCELTSRGLLQLTPDEPLDILKLFRPLEKHLIRRELEKRYRCDGGSVQARQEVTAEDAEQFYQMCLYGILINIREFSEEHLKDFKINTVYQDSFLTQHTERSLDAQCETSFRFGHEMLYEYFAACYFHTASEDSLKSLILAISSLKCLRNVQKIICEILSGKKIQTEDLLQSLIRAILISQHEGDTTEYQLVEEQKKLQKLITSEASVMKLLHTHQDDNAVGEAQAKCYMLDWVFDNSDAGLKSSPWFRNLEINGTIRHVVDCLRSCPTSQQGEIIHCTVHQLLPCTYENDDQTQTTVFAAGSSRWGKVSRMGDSHLDNVDTWCLEDVIEVVQAHTEMYPEQTWGLWVRVYINQYNDMWGEPAECSWSTQAWVSLLQLVPHREKGEELEIYVPESAPLRGLLACPPPEHLSGAGQIGVYSGTARLEEVEEWTTRWQTQGALVLRGTTIVLPTGVSDISLKARIDHLGSKRNKWGEKMIDYENTEWIKVSSTGELYTWLLGPALEPEAGTPMKIEKTEGDMQYDE